MSAFTVLLTAFGLGLATCQDVPMTCREKFDTLMADFPMCATMVNPNVPTLAEGITSAKFECFKCVNGLGTGDRRSQFITPLCNGTERSSFLAKFDDVISNAKAICGANKAAHCSAAEDFLTGKNATLARAQKIENTNMACTCEVRPGMYPKATCNQRKMLFNCAKPNVKTEAKMT
eukprot:974262_1